MRIIIFLYLVFAAQNIYAQYIDTSQNEYSGNINRNYLKYRKSNIINESLKRNLHNPEVRDYYNNVIVPKFNEFVKSHYSSSHENDIYVVDKYLIHRTDVCTYLHSELVQFNYNILAIPERYFFDYNNNGIYDEGEMVDLDKIQEERTLNYDNEESFDFRYSLGNVYFYDQNYNGIKDPNEICFGRVSDWFFGNPYFPENISGGKNVICKVKYSNKNLRIFKIPGWSRPTFMWLDKNNDSYFDENDMILMGGGGSIVNDSKYYGVKGMIPSEYAIFDVNGNDTLDQGEFIVRLNNDITLILSPFIYGDDEAWAQLYADYQAMIEPINLPDPLYIKPFMNDGTGEILGTKLPNIDEFLSFYFVETSEKPIFTANLNYLQKYDPMKFFPKLIYWPENEKYFNKMCMNNGGINIPNGSFHPSYFFAQYNNQYSLYDFDVETNKLRMQSPFLTGESFEGLIGSPSSKSFLYSTGRNKNNPSFILYGGLESSDRGFRFFFKDKFMHRGCLSNQLGDPGKKEEITHPYYVNNSISPTEYAYGSIGCRVFKETVFFDIHSKSNPYYNYTGTQWAENDKIISSYKIVEKDDEVEIYKDDLLICTLKANCLLLANGDKYNRLSNRDEFEYISANSPDGSISKLKVKYEYNDMGQIKSITHSTDSGNNQDIVQNFEYEDENESFYLNGLPKWGKLTNASINGKEIFNCEYDSYGRPVKKKDLFKDSNLSELTFSYTKNFSTTADGMKMIDFDPLTIYRALPNVLEKTIEDNLVSKTFIDYSVTNITNGMFYWYWPIRIIETRQSKVPTDDFSSILPVRTTIERWSSDNITGTTFNYKNHSSSFYTNADNPDKLIKKTYLFNGSSTIITESNLALDDFNRISTENINIDYRTPNSRKILDLNTLNSNVSESKTKQISYLDNSQKSITFNDKNLPETIKNQLNVSTQIEYDFYNRPIHIEAENISSHLYYDLLGNVVRTIQAIGEKEYTESFEYDLKSRLIKYTDHKSRITTILYEDTLERITTTYPDTTTEILEFFKDGRIKKISGTAVSPVEYDYGVVPSKGFFVKQMTTPQNFVISYFDALGNLSTVEQSGVVGPVIIYKYNDFNLVEKITDNFGAELKYEYDDLNRVKKITENGEVGSPEKVVEYAYAFVQAAGKDATKVTITQKGDVATGDYVTEHIQAIKENYQEMVLNGKKITSKFNYGSATAANPNAGGEAGEYNIEIADQNGFKVTTHNKLKSEEYTYKNATDKVLEKVVNRYDNSYLLNSSESLTSSVTMTHDKNSQVKSIESNSSGLVKFDYDADGVIKDITLPNDEKQSFNFTDKGELINISGYGILDYTLEYKDNGQLEKLKTQKLEGDITSKQTTEFVTNDTTGLFEEKKIETESTGVFEYENNLRVKSFTDANTNKTTLGYYINGTIKSLSTIGPNGTRSQFYTYDALGRTQDITDSLTGVCSYIYNIEGQVKEENFGIFQNKYDYDIDNNFESYTLKKSGVAINEVSIELNDDKNLKKIITGDITKEFFYNENTFVVESEVIYKNNIPILTKVYEPDNKQRIEGIKYTNGSNATIHHNKFQFDKLNKYSGIQELVSGKTYSYQYDQKAQLKTATHSDNTGIVADFEFKYDNIGNRKEVIDHKDHHSQVYVSNNLNQYKISVTNNEVMVCGYADADVTVTVNGLPTVRDGTSFEMSFVLPKLSSLLELYIPIQIIGVRDNASESEEKFAKIQGNLVISAGQASFKYDNLGQVIESDRCTYTRDETGSITVIEPKLISSTTPHLNSTVAYSTNAQNYPEANLSLDILYSPKATNYVAITDEDANDTTYEVYYYLQANPTNFISAPILSRVTEDGVVIIDFASVTADGIVVIEKTGSIQLTELSCGLKESKRASPGIKAEYGFDHMGRRISKKLYNPAGAGWDSSPFETKKFVYDGWNLIAELDGSDVVQKTFVWGLDELLAIKVTGGTTYLPITENRNIVKLVNATTGLIDAEYEYSPFGVLLSQSGTAVDVSPFRYKTEYFDKESGLYNFGYRFYDPVNGRWLSREPLGEGAALNLYLYCHNDPINRYDNLGLEDVVFTKLPNGLLKAKVIFTKWERHYLGKPYSIDVPGEFKPLEKPPFMFSFKGDPEFDVDEDSKALIKLYCLTESERSYKNSKILYGDMFERPRKFNYSGDIFTETSFGIENPLFTRFVYLAPQAMYYGTVYGLAVGGSVAQITGGVALALIPSPGITQTGGALVVLDGIDNLQSLVSGKSFIVSGLEGVGINSDAANYGKTALTLSTIPLTIGAGFYKVPTGLKALNAESKAINTELNIVKSEIKYELQYGDDAILGDGVHFPLKDVTAESIFKDPVSIYSLSGDDVGALLLKEGFVDTTVSYTGNSKVAVFTKVINTQKWEVVVNYGEGLHSGGQVFTSPYYYKITGVNMPKTKVISPFYLDDWSVQTSWRIIEGETGKVLKEANVFIKK